MNTDRQIDYTARIVVAWAIVGIPLAYGLYHAIMAAAKLFAE